MGLTQRKSKLPPPEVVLRLGAKSSQPPSLRFGSYRFHKNCEIGPCLPDVYILETAFSGPFLGCKTGMKLREDLYLKGTEKRFTIKFSKVNTLGKGRSGVRVRKKRVQTSVKLRGS